MGCGVVIRSRLRVAFETALELPRGEHAALFAVFGERLVEALFIDRQSSLRGEFLGELQRKTVGVVQSERLLTAYFRFLHVRGVALGHKLVFAFERGYALFEFLYALR